MTGSFDDSSMFVVFSFEGILIFRDLPIRSKFTQRSLTLLSIFLRFLVVLFLESSTLRWIVQRSLSVRETRQGLLRLWYWSIWLGYCNDESKRPLANGRMRTALADRPVRTSARVQNGEWGNNKWSGEFFLNKNDCEFILINFIENLLTGLQQLKFDLFCVCLVPYERKLVVVKK